MPARLCPNETKTDIIDATKLACEVTDSPTPTRIGNSISELFGVKCQPSKIIKENPMLFTAGMQNNSRTGALETHYGVHNEHRTFQGPVIVRGRFIPRIKTTPLSLPNQFKITITNQAADAEAWIQEHVKESFIGIDTEFHSQTSTLQLVQLSTATACILFRVERTIPKGLVSLLNNQNVLKVWADYYCDKQVIQKNLYKPNQLPVVLDFKSWFDIDTANPKVGIRKMLLYHMGLVIDKELARSDWSTPTLTDKQIEYAAMDAYSNYILYKYIKEKNRPFALHEDYEFKA